MAVAEELNFRRAAARVYVAQGAFSEQVRKLERELDVRLLDRSPRGVSLTTAGAALLPEARRVLHQAEVARLAPQGARDRASSRLRIGYVPAAVPACVPRAAQRLAATMPVVETSMERGEVAQLIRAVRDGWLDAAVIPMPAPVAGLRVTALGPQRIVAALPVTHEHATKDEIRLAHLAPARILVLPREANRPLYDGILAGCHAAGLSPSLVELPGTDLDHALLAVASTGGIALLPESFAERHCAPGLRFVFLTAEEPTFAVAVVTRPDTQHMTTIAFLRTVSALATSRQVAAPRAALRSTEC